MKTSIITCVILAFGLTGYSQDGEELLSKKGHEIRPVSGDIGLGFNAIPMFNYVGNMFNNTVGDTVNATFVNNDNVIYGKYFTQSDMAIRARVRLRDIYTTERNLVVKQEQLDPNVKVEDMRVTNDQKFQFSVGVEKRRGKGRVTGIYGAELFLTTDKITMDYTYGNAMTEPYIIPLSTTNFITGATAKTSNRILSFNSGRMWTYGVLGFIGVEYAFAPKMAVTAEFNWGLGYSVAGSSETVNEKYTNKTEKETLNTSGRKVFTMDTGNNGGAIALLFYF